MDHAVEASTQRVRDHLRRPLAGSRNLLTTTDGNCLAPGLMEVRIPRKDASYGSTTEVSR